MFSAENFWENILNYFQKFLAIFFFQILAKNIWFYMILLN